MKILLALSAGCLVGAVDISMLPVYFLSMIFWLDSPRGWWERL